MLLLHYTGLDTAANAIDWLSRAESKVSATTSSTRPAASRRWWRRSMRAWHAGLPCGRARRDINSASIGIEIHNRGHELGCPDFPEPQLQALEALCRDIIARQGIRRERVLAHSDVAPTRKKDPGEKFPWARLAERVSATGWPRAGQLGRSRHRPRRRRPAGGGRADPARQYGYGIEATGGFDPKTEFVVTAFQRHFRPERVDGRIDQSTITTLERLPRRCRPTRRAHERDEKTHGAGGHAADRLDAPAVLTLIACCACWGVNQVAIKVANAGISPILQAGLRSALACVLVFAWAAARGVRLFERDGTLWVGLFAGLLFGRRVRDVYLGLAHTTASRGIVLLYLAPFVVAVGAHYLIPGDRLTVPKVLGLTAALPAWP